MSSNKIATAREKFATRTADYVVVVVVVVVRSEDLLYMIKKATNSILAYDEIGLRNV